MTERPPDEAAPSEVPAGTPGPAEPPYDPAHPPQPTAPVPGPPSVRSRPETAARRTPRMQMGPWAPVAGAGLGLLVGVAVSATLLAGVLLGFPERLALVFLCLGLALLGAGGVLLAEEVRLRRRGVRAQSAEVVTGLLNGLTPARLLVGSAGFVLLLAAYVGRG